MAISKSDIDKAMGRKAEKITPWFDEETGRRMGYTLHYSLKKSAPKKSRKPKAKAAR